MPKSSCLFCIIQFFFFFFVILCFCLFCDTHQTKILYFFERVALCPCTLILCNFSLIFSIFVESILHFYHSMLDRTYRFCLTSILVHHRVNTWVANFWWQKPFLCPVKCSVFLASTAKFWNTFFRSRNKMKFNIFFWILL